MLLTFPVGQDAAYLANSFTHFKAFFHSQHDRSEPRSPAPSIVGNSFMVDILPDLELYKQQEQNCRELGNKQDLSASLGICDGLS